MSQKPPPEFSIIIPVYHEQKIIQQTIHHLQTITKNYSTELIIVDGSEHQDTIHTITDPNIKTISTKKGRGTQLHTGAQHANGTILIFLHADTQLPSNALLKIKTALTQPHIIAGAFSLQIASPTLRYKILSHLINIRAHLTRLPFGDQAHFITKKNYHTQTQYPTIPLMEDLAFMRTIRKNHQKIIILPDQVTTSPRRWQQEGILNSTLRNWYIRIKYYCGQSPHQLTKYYQKKP